MTRMVCASAGNLGQALAYSGSRHGMAVTVVAARTANPLKLRRIAELGATVELAGDDIEDARARARVLAAEQDAYLVEDSLDLATCEAVRLAPGERALVPTGLAVAIPEGYAGFVQPRSGLAARDGITVVNSPGLVDAGYRGEIQVVLLNTDQERTFTAEAGEDSVLFSFSDRAAQKALGLWREQAPVAAG